MPFSYSMNEADNIAQLAYKDIEKYLKHFDVTDEVIDVQNDKRFQSLDIDLLWKRTVNGNKETIKIEIKGDRWHRTGNYFFETISNNNKNTPGCFMYTEADYIFYYFLEIKELHILPMPTTRNWFVLHQDDFEEKATSTPGANGQIAYKTIGKLVPKKTLHDNKKLPFQIKVVKLNNCLK
ncbi:hypothetical protein [uncultured Rummeliibacillus sp.]|uniref:hypothetical protein n=1 Tax=uncultured Rummeliibacillus sp. TaxID=762292 RepID=UPI002614C0E9|nr:hypothetical protein [uncultured Rummeliibacillus sp.]